MHNSTTTFNLGGVLDAFDLSENLTKAFIAVEQMRGSVALLMSATFGLLAVGIFPLMWYFDIDSTLEWSIILMDYIAPSLPMETDIFIVAFIIALTMIPTLIEVGTARLAIHRIGMLKFLIFFFCTFDLVTDYPRIDAMFNDPQLHALIGDSFVAHYIAKYALLFIASFVLEMFFVIFIVLCVYLFVKSLYGYAATGFRNLFMPVQFQYPQQKKGGKP